MLTIAIDPGLHKCGVAVFNKNTKQLLWAGTVARSSGACHLRPSGARAWVEMAERVRGELDSRFLIRSSNFIFGVEEMQQDGRTRGRSIQDTMQVQGVVGALSSEFNNLAGCSHLQSITPSTWKGNMPKSVMRNRIKDRLSLEELKAIDSSSTHDAWDAVGIGLYMLRGRL